MTGVLVTFLTRQVLRPILRLTYRPSVEGREHVPAAGPVILAANHLSFFDSVVIPMVAPRPVAFLAKAEYFTGRGITGWVTREFFTALGAIPVQRGTHGAVREPLETALEVLGGGGIFGIYPEGSRSRDGRLYRGRTGVAWLALRSGAPIVPVGLIGTERIQPVGTRFPRLHRVTVRFGPPVQLPAGAEQARPAQLRREITAAVMAAIGDLTGQERAAEYNDPPEQ